MRAGDTIVALSSGALPSGVAVVRLSGPAVRPLLQSLTGTVPPPRQLALRDINLPDGRLDQGLVAFFPNPKSFTGEDCAELHLHGSTAVVRRLLRELAGQYGVRLAEAGEFTRRAFENGKLDLTEVEGLGDLIGAETENQRKLALSRLSGNLSSAILGWREHLLDLRAEIEAQLDFSDEGDVGEGLPQRFFDGLATLETDMQRALDGLSRGRIVREGLRVALAGAPNAGKSSLLNALAQNEVSIVTDEPGTTRDVREVAIELDGQLIVLLDMAGLRETDSKAEAEGVRRARQEIARADLVLWLEAPDAAAVIRETSDAPSWTIQTKADLRLESGAALSVSSTTGQGIDTLLDRLKVFAASQISQGDSALLSRERDRVAIETALSALREARTMADTSEVSAEALRTASHALERLLGRMDSEQVLDRLFAAFCIGK
jgi:tRNA modification GTPase